jgi:hypothetical protein
MAEHIRSYNQVSTTLPHSKYRRRLNLLQKVLWDDLVSWPTYCGLFSIDVEERAFYHAVSISEIEEALERFEADGKIKLDGEFIWVLEFIQHQSYNTNGLKAAINELLPLTFKTGLASEHYRNITGTLPEGSMKVIAYHNRSDQIKSEQIRSVSLAPLANLPVTLPEDSPNVTGTLQERSPNLPSIKKFQTAKKPPPRPQPKPEQPETRKPTPKEREAAEAQTLAKNESRLGAQSLQAWGLFKNAMDDKRVSKGCATGRKITILVEFLASAEKWHFTDEEVSAGLLGCMKAQSDPPAENEVYFRKCCNSYRINQATGLDFDGERRNGDRQPSRMLDYADKVGDDD